jgi:uncharacterized protein YcfJ
MRVTPLFLLCAAGLIGCGGDTSDPAMEPEATTVVDSLVPIADAAELPDDRPPAPAETVFVPQPQPPRAAASRPTPSRQTPPAAAVTPRPAAAPEPAAAEPAQPAAAALASGTAVSTTAIDSIHSRFNKVGDPVRVRVASAILGEDGAVIIPAGAVMTLAIVEIAPAANKGETGTLVLAARSVSIDGTSYPISARSSDLEYTMRGRGVTSTEAAKTGAGAVAGGIIGRVIGGNKTGTIVGAAAGAAAGAAVADKQADRDIVVEAGKSITLTLRDRFERP